MPRTKLGKVYQSSKSARNQPWTKTGLWQNFYSKISMRLNSDQIQTQKQTQIQVYQSSKSARNRPWTKTGLWHTRANFYSKITYVWIWNTKTNTFDTPGQTFFSKIFERLNSDQIQTQRQTHKEAFDTPGQTFIQRFTYDWIWNTKTNTFDIPGQTFVQRLSSVWIHIKYKRKDKHKQRPSTH